MVTNVWSPKHISIKFQKLDPEFNSPNSILVNSCNPEDPAWNAVLWISASATGICKYPCTKLNEENHWQLCTACSALSILSKGKASLITIELQGEYLLIFIYTKIHSWSCCSLVNGASSRLNLNGNYMISFSNLLSSSIIGLFPNLG